MRRLLAVGSGFLLLLAGTVMLFTPGPGLAVMLGGLVVLAKEFTWARSLLLTLKKRFKGARRALRRRPAAAA